MRAGLLARQNTAATTMMASATARCHRTALPRVDHNRHFQDYSDPIEIRILIWFVYLG